MADETVNEEEEMEDINSAWETESGLVDDFDGTIRNAHFGTKEEYAQAVMLSNTEGATGAMILFDLMSDDGELVTQQGWSIGTGWTISEDGFIITHPKRQNVVTSSLYGMLQNTTIKELHVPMGKYGSPLDARSWEGLKFHWMIKTHKDLKGNDKNGLMPVEFFGKVEGEDNETSSKPAASSSKKAAPATKKAAPAASKAREAALKLVKLSDDVEQFQKLAMKNEDIANDDKLMAEILKDDEEGFYALNKSE